VNAPVRACDTASVPGVTAPASSAATSVGVEVDVLPASFGQARLWFLDRLNPGSVAYVSDVPLRVRGPFDVAAFEHALGVVVARHEALRTWFAAVEGEPVQVVVPELRISVDRVDLSGTDDPLMAGRALAGQIATTRFDLTRGPLIRVVAARLGADDWALLLALHHIIVDAWSLGVLLAELAEAYCARMASRPPRLPQLTLQYGDYAIWQRERFRGARLAEQLDYWRNQLRDPPPLRLPTDRLRPALPSQQGGREAITIEASVVTALRALAQAENASLFMCLLAAYGVLLHRWSDQTDLLVGTPVAGRTRANLEPLIGFFVNMLVLRLDLSGQPTFRELLRRTRNVALDAYSQQDIPFERLVSELAPERRLSHNPLFETTFSLQSAAKANLWPGLEVSHLTIPHESVRFDLALTCAEVGDQLVARFTYATDLFDTSTIRRMAAHLGILLRDLCRDPDTPVGQLRLLTATECAALDGCNTTESPVPGGCIHELFAAHVQRNPHAPAIEYDGGVVSYLDLDRRSERLAQVLTALGAEPDRPVALLLDHGVELVSAQLGVLKAGAAFLPLDVTTPTRRIAALLAAARPLAVLTTTEHAGLLPQDTPTVLLLDRRLPTEPEPTWSAGKVTSASLAYLIATSGTTGPPKLVEIEHRSVVNYLTWFNTTVIRDHRARMPTLSSPAFDASVKQLMGPLLRGGTVWLPSLEERLDPARLLAALAARPHVALNCVPAIWESLLDHLDATATRPPGSLELVLLGGERLTDQLAARTFATIPSVRLWNLYGPTEATVNALGGMVGPAELVTIGTPIANTTAHVLGPGGAAQPVGVPGELYLGGLGLARGYRDDPAQTQAMFGPHPHSPGRRLYRTGDRVVRLPDGRVRFIGRNDAQVKIRGVRIELDEIAALLREHPTVRDAVVVPYADGLAAYLVAIGEPAPAHELREHLAAWLPRAALPATFTPLDRLPVTVVGKLDRAALPAPRTGITVAASRETRTVTEERVAATWRELLERNDFGRDDNFFDVGGHSLLLIRVHARLRPTAPRLSVLDLFQYPTLRTLAARIDVLCAGGSQPAEDQA
jgi:amino acid adenylation domain-containing protein